MRRWSGFFAWALVGLCFTPSFVTMMFTVPAGLMLAVVLVARRRTGKEMLGLLWGVGAIIAFLGFVNLDLHPCRGADGIQLCNNDGGFNGLPWLILGLALMVLAVLVYRRLSRKRDRDRDESLEERVSAGPSIQGAAGPWPGFLGWTLVGMSLAPPGISMMVYTVPAGLVLTALLARRHAGWKMLGVLEGVGMTSALSNLLDRDWSCSATGSAVLRPDGTMSIERTTSSCEGFGTPWLIAGLALMVLAALAYWWLSRKEDRPEALPG